MIRRVRNLLTNLLDPLGRWIDDHADQIVHVILHRVTRALTAWLLLLLAAGLLFDGAWHSFDNGNYEDGNRVDGNYGHSTIDFGGQWMMGAMLTRGHGRQLYNRNVQREVLMAAYPREREDPTAKRADAEKLMTYFMGTDRSRSAEIVGSFVVPLAANDALGAGAWLVACEDQWTPDVLELAVKPAVGGPLYPPINSLVYAPLGMMSPPVAYRVNQVLNLFWAFVAALGVRYLTHGRIWVSVAALLIVLYPGFKGSIFLGQNASLTLAILIWGWALIARDRPIRGGVVWGLLAFKPVWAAAFILVPFLTFRWRTCLAMIATGAVLALLTLPFVGWRPWLDWLKVGHEATELYKTDYNWVFLSRDLLGIPRRWMLDFSLPSAQRDTWIAGVVGWSIYGTCLLFTVLLPLLHRRQARQTTGTAAGFMLLGAWLSCFHFMYYDVLLTALPMFVLLADPRPYLEPIFVAIVPMAGERPDGDFAAYFGPWPPDRCPPRVPFLQPTHRNIWVLNRMVPTFLALLLVVEHGFPSAGFGLTASFAHWHSTLRLTTAIYDDGIPWDTFCTIGLWLWCGFLWLRAPRPARPPAEEPVYKKAIPAVEKSEQITRLE